MRWDWKQIEWEGHEIMVLFALVCTEYANFDPLYKMDKKIVNKIGTTHTNARSDAQNIRLILNFLGLPEQC